MSSLNDYNPTPRDYLLSPVRTIMLLWDRFVSSKERSIADLDITIADQITARVKALTLIAALSILGIILIAVHVHIQVALPARQHESDIIWSLLTSHFGIAFLVAAVAAIGYEFFAHHHKLQEQIFTLFRINHHVAELQVDAVLQKLLPNRVGDDGVNAQLRQDVNQTIHSISAIDETGVTARVVSLRFIATLLKYARDAAHTLQTSWELDNPHELRFPASAAALADEILAAQLKVLRSGDEYVVVSDFSTWHDWQLHQFWDTLSTMTEAVNVTRVFCAFSHDKSSISPCEARQILRLHWDLAETLALKSGVIYNVGINPTAEADHIGIFAHGDNLLCFEPHGRGRLTSLTVSHEKRSDRGKLANFNGVWRDAIRWHEGAGVRRSFDEVTILLDEKGFFAEFVGCGRCAKLHSLPCVCATQHLGGTRKSK
jgi:hypothetical protein